jgi:hypothetical protein
LDAVNGTNVLKNQEHRKTGDPNNSMYHHFTIDNTKKSAIHFNIVVNALNLVVDI